MDSDCVEPLVIDAHRIRPVAIRNTENMQSPLQDRGRNNVIILHAFDLFFSVAFWALARSGTTVT